MVVADAITWARSWSVVVGGGKFKRGTVVGGTNADGTEIDTSLSKPTPRKI